MSPIDCSEFSQTSHLAQPPPTKSRKGHSYPHKNLLSHIEKTLERVKQHSDFQPTKTIIIMF